MKKLTQIKGTLSASLFLLGSVATAAPIGIVDSGTDIKHPDLASKTWTKPADLNDGYTDDIHGWNFADNNNQIIDYSFLGKFSPDTTKFFEVQLRILKGTATDEDKKWLEEKRKDQKFIQELSTFGNFIHGTHVAGISARTAPQAQIMAAKIIPTEVKVPTIMTAVSSLLPSITPSAAEGFGDDLLMQGTLWLLAGQQTKTLVTVGEYLKKTGMLVANCSFGTSMVQAKLVVGMLGKTLLSRDLTAEETAKYASYFIKQVLEKGSAFVKASEKTLFAIAAGNDGTDNDKEPVFPANLKFDNTITVAATRDYDRLASFSNYGATRVDIAAPGVGIVSSIPGNSSLPLSGTSQAAPFVANLAGKVIDANPKLSPGEVKQLLMQTVDRKSFLEGKVVSGGIANEDRALHAANLSTKESLNDAIRHSQTAVMDVRTNQSRFGMGVSPRTDSRDDGMPIPLPSLFQMKE